MSKSNKKSTKTAARPFQVMCTDLYLLWILIAFPLYYADGYFHLPENKSIFWCTSTLVYLGVTLFGVVITALSMREYWSFENFKKNITMTDVFMFGFLICNLIALAISDDKMNSWTGQSSRYYGAKVLILVCLVYFMVSRYGWMNKVFINAFLIGGNGVCLLATFDYFGMDVLGINQQMQQWDWLIFISTMGNANTCASYVCMAVVGAMVYFCVAEEKKSKIFSGISIVNCGVALITARSDSAFLGAAVIILVLGTLVFAKKIELKNYILTISLLDIGFLILFLLRKKFVDHLILESFDSGLQRTLNQPMLLSMLLALLMIAYGVAVHIEKKEIKIKKNMRIMLTVSALLGIILLGTFMFSKLDILNIFIQSIGQRNGVVVGSRQYTYERVIQAYGKLPLKNKLFGCGQATMSSVLYQYFGEELSAAGISINSAHNNILDYLIIIGFCGVVCYLGTIIFAVKHVYSAIKENKKALVFGLIVVAYFAQGIFNIDQTTTTTVFWLMIACCEAMYRETIVKK